MIFNIDLDRGVLSRSDPQTGMDVYMYVDEPGVYRSAHGTEVNVELAHRAGFEVDEHLKKRKVQLALASARDRVLAEMEQANTGEKVVMAERDGFKIIDIGYDRYNVLSPDGDKLNKEPLGKREAVILLEQLAPEPEKKEVKLEVKKPK